MTLAAPVSGDGAPEAPPREHGPVTRVLGRRVPGPLLVPVGEDFEVRAALTDERPPLATMG